MCDRRLLRSLIVKGIIENAKLPLLQQLKRNMPNYFVCRCCFLLHQYDGSGSLGLTCLRPNWNCPLPCIRRAQWKVGHLELDTHDDTAHVYYLFYFLHIQLAMRRFSHGPRCGTTVESLAHIEITEYDRSTTLFFIEARIFPSHLHRVYAYESRA